MMLTSPHSLLLLTDYLITTFNIFLPGGQKIVAKAPAAKKTPTKKAAVKKAATKKSGSPAKAVPKVAEAAVAQAPLNVPIICQIGLYTFKT